MHVQRVRMALSCVCLTFRGIEFSHGREFLKFSVWLLVKHYSADIVLATCSWRECSS